MNRTDNIPNIISSNREIIKLISQDKPFIISRLGGNITYTTLEYLLSNKITTKYLHPKLLTLYHDGIYTKKPDLKLIELFCISYNNAIKNSDLLASFVNMPSLYKSQEYFSSNYNLSQIHSRGLEPFHVINEGAIPWTHSLNGKKVLVINSFTDSFQKQLAAGFQIFKEPSKKIFLDEQEFVFYKSYQTIGGNHIHDSWFETFTLMCKDIEKIDFDIALLGCGGYGLPLCNFIKTKLKKSSIYIGGGLQLLFGVMGSRWENIDMWKKIIKENDCKFIKPSGNEICDNLKTIENGCYI